MVAAMVLALVSQWVLQFPLAYVLSRPQVLGTAGLWWSFPVTNVLTAVAAVGSTIGVSSGPGAMAFTVTPLAARSRANTLVRVVMAPLEAA